jgi:hypothetical protein
MQRYTPMTRIRQYHVLIGMLLLSTCGFVFPLAAQQDMFVPERPGLTWSTGIAKRGFLHVEGGLSMEYASFAPARAEGSFEEGEVFRNTIWKVPAVMLRLGIRDGLEFRLAGMYIRNTWSYDAEYFNSGNRSGERVEDAASGLNVLSVGIKTRLTSEHGWLPESAFLASLAIPSLASSWFDIAQPAPDIAVSFSHTPSSDLSFGYCGGLSWDGYTASPMGYASAMLAFALDTRMNLFLEYGVQVHAHAPALHTVDAGLAFTIHEHLILDAILAFGIGQPGATTANPHYVAIAHTDLLVGLGASYRVELTP